MRHDKKKHAIIDALDVLARGASKKTDGKITAVNVQKEAGVSKATLYRYFNKYQELSDAFETIKRNGSRSTEDAPKTLQDRYRLLQLEVKSLRSELAQVRANAAKMDKLKSHQIQLLWMDNERLQREVERRSALGIKPDNVTLLPIKNVPVSEPRDE